MMKITRIFDDITLYDQFKEYMETVGTTSTKTTKIMGTESVEIIIDENNPALSTLKTTYGFVEDSDYVHPVPIDNSAELARIEAEHQRQQTELNNGINRRAIIESLGELQYHEKTKSEYDILSYEDLVTYHNIMLEKPARIMEYLKLNGMEDTPANWDAQGRKTIDDIKNEIKRSRR